MTYKCPHCKHLDPDGRDLHRCPSLVYTLERDYLVESAAWCNELGLITEQNEHIFYKERPS